MNVTAVSLGYRSVPVLALLYLSSACSDLHPAPTSSDDPPTHVAADTIVGGGGVRLSVREAGNPQGPSIVLIHGFTGSHLTWEHQISGPLAEDFRLVTYDLRGHGESEKPLEPEQYTTSAWWAEDLAAVIHSKGLQRPVLVGWSYGGYVISDYIRRYGDENLGGVVFVAPATKSGTEEAMGFLTEEVLAVFGDLLGKDLRRSIDATRTLTRMFAGSLDDAAWETAYGSAMMVPPEVRSAMFSRVLDNDDVLRRIQVPTLVIHGSGDRIVRPRASEHVAGTVKRGTLLVYRGVGHAPFLEAGERFDRDLAEFVGSVSGGRR